MPSNKYLLCCVAAAWLCVASAVVAQTDPAAQAKTVAELVKADSARALAGTRPTQPVATTAAAPHVRRVVRPAGPREPRVELKETWGVVPQVKALAEIDGVPTILTAGQRVGSAVVVHVGGGCVSLARHGATDPETKPNKSQRKVGASATTRQVCVVPAYTQAVASGVAAPTGTVSVPSPLVGLPPGTPITTGGPLPR